MSKVMKITIIIWFIVVAVITALYLLPKIVAIVFGWTALIIVMAFMIFAIIYMIVSDFVRPSIDDRLE